ncbi:MAG: AMP-binding protein, partial [Pseudomonadota bacterium]|nr:AMP-binding protein [Pseudomonadota bacterium]
SGTTGHPKGAMHSHRTPALVMPKILKSAGIGEYGAADRQRCELISYLPLAHMAERVFVEMISLYANAQVSISRGVETFSEEIREVKPTFFFSVPRLWDRFKMSVEQMVGNADPSTWSTLEKQKILTALGLKRVEFAMNASAPLCIATGEWFKALGISIREGYGMTETFATGTTFSIDQDSVVGSAGYASELAEVAIADDGEILFRAPGLMRGYYNNQQATAQAISDGWYRTGDSGVLDDKGLLWVKGRMGAVFKTSKGKFIHPELIEERFKGLSDIEHGVAFGHARKQPSMIVCLSDTGRNRNSTDLTNSIENYVSAANADIPAYQKVETVFVVRDSWSVSTGLLTPTQKPKRQNILELYLEKIGSIRDPSEVEFI